jgi:hypothetical protein
MGVCKNMSLESKETKKPMVKWMFPEKTQKEQNVIQKITIQIKNNQKKELHYWLMFVG